MKRFFVMVAVLAMVLPSCENRGNLEQSCSHSWIEGVCSACGEECQHSWRDGICDICGKECQHSIEDGLCTNCGYKQYEYDKESNTYYVATMEGLYAWNRAVNKDYTTNLSLTSDITCKGDEDKWIPVIAEGLVEGNGYAIIGWSKTYFILDVQNGGFVQNINFKDVNIVNESSTYAGIICRVDEQSMVSNCRLSGNISHSGGCVGFICYNNGFVSNCINEATISSKGSNVGGIVAYNLRGKVVACLNLSTSVSGNQYVGSIVGQNPAGVYGCLGIISTSGEGKLMATECVGENTNEGEASGCIVVNSMADVTAEHIATMNEALAALGYSHRWVEGKDGGVPGFSTAE